MKIHGAYTNNLLQGKKNKRKILRKKRIRRRRDTFKMYLFFIEKIIFKKGELYETQSNN